MGVREITTDEEPLEQKNVQELINAGYSLDLLLQHRIDDAGVSQYFLFAKYRGHLREIYTQRATPRSFVHLIRAIDWGKRMGFKKVSLNLDYEQYPDSGED